MPEGEPTSACQHRARKSSLKTYGIRLSGPDIGLVTRLKKLPPVKALKGSGKFDVLEVWGYIYKAEYRMRFIYAQIPDSCLLMGQEILEASDPY